jgi:hypothetical protein
MGAVKNGADPDCEVLSALAAVVHGPFVFARGDFVRTAIWADRAVRPKDGHEIGYCGFLVRKALHQRIGRENPHPAPPALSVGVDFFEPQRSCHALSVTCLSLFFRQI